MQTDIWKLMGIYPRTSIMHDNWKCTRDWSMWQSFWRKLFVMFLEHQSKLKLYVLKVLMIVAFNNFSTVSQ